MFNFVFIFLSLLPKGMCYNKFNIVLGKNNTSKTFPEISRDTLGFHQTRVGNHLLKQCCSFRSSRGVSLGLGYQARVFL